MRAYVMMRLLQVLTLFRGFILEVWPRCLRPRNFSSPMLEEADRLIWALATTVEEAKGTEAVRTRATCRAPGCWPCGWFWSRLQHCL